MMISRKYEVLSPVGQGGMGVVYKVRHVVLETILALKVLPRDLMANPEMVSRFYREARVMARLRHPNIVRVLDIDHDEELGFHYFVMEYIQGKTLRAHVHENGPLPLPEVLTIAAQVARALVYAHAHTPPIIHRDIKPANIMIEDGSSRVVVMDFGIAKELGDGEMTKSGVVLGTLKYCPPEQLRNEPLDGSADVYGLGMAMYEAYTGGHLFAGVDEAGVIGKVLYETGENEPNFTRPTPLLFTALVRRAIAKSREGRYRHMEEFLHDIEACFASLNEDKTVSLMIAEKEEVPGQVAINVLDEKIRKLEAERQWQLVAVTRTQAQEARAKAITIGAERFATGPLRQGEEQETLGYKFLQQGNNDAALTAYRTALDLFIKAHEDAGATAALQAAEQARQEMQTAKIAAERSGARENARNAEDISGSWSGIPVFRSSENLTSPGQDIQQPTPQQTNEDHWEIGERGETLEYDSLPRETPPPSNRTSLLGIGVVVAFVVLGWIGWSLLPQSAVPPVEVASPPQSQPPPPPALVLSQSEPQAETVKIAEGESVSFAVQALGVEPFTYEWTLDGGSVSQERQWTYHSLKGEKGDGTKTVRVQVSDQHGQSMEKSWRVFVTPGNQPPRMILATPLQSTVELRSGEGQSFSLEAEDPEREKLDYEWTVDGKNTSRQPTFTWKAHEEGKHQIKVVARDQAGLSVSQEWQVAVVAPPATLTPPSLPKNAAPRITQLLPVDRVVSVQEKETIEFSALALDPDGEEVIYNWAVDGQQAAQGNRFTYTAGTAGKHRIALEVADKGGLTDSFSWEVRIEAPPAAPRVAMYTPHKERLQLYAHLSRFFGVEVETPGLLESPIRYAWTINGRPAAGRELLEFKNQSPGRHEVEVMATGPSGASVSHRWVVDVRERQGADDQGMSGPPHLEMFELDNEVSADKKQVVVKGKLRNVGDREAENVLVWISSLDAHQGAISRRLALPSPQPLAPGQVATFTLAFTNRKEISDFRVEIVSK